MKMKEYGPREGGVSQAPLGSANGEVYKIPYYPKNAQVLRGLFWK